MASGYTVAGCETLMTIIQNFMNGRRGTFENNFTITDISNFFGNVCNRFLHSYGQNFKGKKKYNKYSKKEAEVYEILRDSGFFNSSSLICDSGAFQISIGMLNKVESELLISMYYDFLSDYKDSYDEAFILDIPPGPGCQVFSNFDEVYTKNLDSYLTAANLSDDIRRKIIYVHHFRTPKLWNIYNSILRENDLFSRFEKFATGGIVANSSGDSEIPCVIYVLPLIPLLNEAIKHGKTSLDFHILGGATFRDLLFYELFKHHVMKVHNIELNITYDSSGLFKGLMVGRYFSYLDNETIRKVDIRTNNLEMKLFNRDGMKVSDICQEVIKDFAGRNNFKEISFNHIYDESIGTFYEEVKVYLMLYMLQFYQDVEELMHKKVLDIYPLYESGDLVNFMLESEQITRNLNQGKISRKQISKSNSIIKSLEMLTNLDENYCEYIVNKFLAKDEFMNLTKGNIMTI